MTTRQIVIDTNVVIKFFVQESDSILARGLLATVLSAEVELAAPDFMLIEFANVVWLKVERGELDGDEAEQIIAQFFSLVEFIEIIPAGRILSDVFRIARLHHHSAYDAAFLALAEGRGVSLLTADRKFYQKARILSSRLVLLRDWETALR